MLPSFLIDPNITTLDRSSDRGLAEYEAAGNQIKYYDRLCWPTTRTFAVLADTAQEFEVPQSERNCGSMMPRLTDEVIRSPPIWPLRDLEMPESDLSIQHLNSLLYTDEPSTEDQKSPLWPLDDLQCGHADDVDADKNSTVRGGAKVAVADLYTEADDARQIDESRIGISQAGGDPTGTSMNAAQHSVLLTAELLEIILFFLPSTDLWKMTHVCHSWSEFIMSSPTLRKNLWFTSESAPQMPTRPYRNPDGVYFAANEVLDSLNLIRGNSFTQTDNFRASFSFPARWLVVKAPWRDMQICEPPIKQVFLSSSWLDKYLYCETGITAGQVADRVELSRTGTLRAFHSA